MRSIQASRAEPVRCTAALVSERCPTTVMFTDIVDSTQRAAALGDTRWVDLQQAHDVLLRRAIRLHRGRVVTSTGDGLLAVFRSPAAGVRCAVMITAEIRALGIEVRAGVHSGECERRGKWLGGLVFHIGARVAALAGAGEVLVSHAVKDRAADAGLSFRDRGTHELKGLPGAWPMYAASMV